MKTPKKKSTPTSGDDRNWKAVRRFKELESGLSTMASAIAGKHVKVTTGSVTESSSDTIFIVPPKRLGDDIPHTRCNRYDKSGRSECEACAVHEELLALLYHEIAHHSGGSFDATKAVEIAKKENEYLPILTNMVEDARINKVMGDARPGSRRILRVVLSETLNRPAVMAGLDKSKQLLLAGCADAEGYTVPSELFCTEVRYVREQVKYHELVGKWQTLSSAIDSLTAAREFMTYAQQFGFFIDEKQYEEQNPTPEESDDEPESSPEDQQQSEDEADSPAETKDPQENPGSGSDDAEPREDQASDDDQDSSDAPNGDEPDEQEGSQEDASEDQSDREGEPQPEDSESDDGGSDETGGTDAPSSGMGDAEESAGGSHQGSDPSGDSTPAEDERDTDASGGDGSTSSDPSQGGQDGEGESPEHVSAKGTGEIAASSSGVGDADTDATQPDYQDGPPDAPQGNVRPADDTAGPDPTPEPADPGRPDPCAGWEDHLDKYGTPESLKEFAEELTGHAADQLEDEADYDMEKALEQFEVFDGPSVQLTGVRAVSDNSGSWLYTGLPYGGMPGVFGMRLPSEHALQKDFQAHLPGPAEYVTHAQRLKFVFAENDRSRNEPNLKRGKVNTRVLGKRAPLGDDRLFKKKTQPKNRDYFVVIGMDVSGSSAYGTVLRDEKLAVYAQAKLLERLNIPFEIYAHTSIGTRDQAFGTIEHRLGVYVVKTRDEAFDETTIRALASIPSNGGNMDGHALQFLRKRAQTSRATDRIVMYYSDGAMLNNNSVEERAILETELDICRRDRIALPAVGIGNDDPSEYGFPMVRYDDLSDIPVVIEHIAKSLDTH